MITLTAPGKAGHKRNIGGRFVREQGKDGKWHSGYQGGTWVECDCTPVDFDLSAWNADASARWNRLWANDLQRKPYFRVLHGAAYFRAAETQKRGAVHYHVLVQVSEGTVLPPDFAKRLGWLAEDHGFGHVSDVQEIDGARAAGYVAKYVSKGSDDRPHVPWKRLRTRKLSAPVPVPNVREVDNGWVQFGPWPEVRDVTYVSRRATYRTWSSSRSWPRSMRDVLAARAHFAALMGVLPRWDGQGVLSGPLDGTWAHAGCPVRPDYVPPEDVAWEQAWAM